MNRGGTLNINRIDLNLLVYLDALLRERNVTQAANQLNLSQPAMSNGLRRLRAISDEEWQAAVEADEANGGP